MKFTKRTKLIATIGPSSETKEMMIKLFENGMTAIRLNFSHGDYEEQGVRIKLAHQIAKEMGLPLSIILDTKGPEIRVGKFDGGKQQVFQDQIIKIYSDDASYKNKKSKKGEMTVSYDMSNDLSKDKIVLVDDGKLQLKVLSVKPKIIEVVALNHHVVKENKRINLPGTKFSMPFLSEKDKNDIIFGTKNDVHYIAASFVNTPENVNEIRDILKNHDAEHIKIFAKIESQYAIDNFDSILKVADGIMIARGDLGLEIPYYDVPVYEKMMIRKCRENGKPVIVATQMLDSMENNPHPTRAEVTDVYLAVELGADATMLSGESAAGEYPLQSVQVMSKISMRAEKEFYNKLFYPIQLENIKKVSHGHRAEIALSVAEKAIDGEYEFAVVLSRTGELLSEVAKFRPNTKIIGITNNEKIISSFGITSSVFMFPSITAFNDLKKDKSLAKSIVKKFSDGKSCKFLIVENEQIIKDSI